jgi:hypothetical protein
MRTLDCAIIGIVAAGCGTGSNPAAMTLEAGPSTADAGGVDAEVFADDAGPASQRGCAESAKIVYVLTKNYELYGFDPTKPALTKRGVVACSNPGQDINFPTNPATPNSMAVDRKGVAWVNYSSGKLFKVSTEDAACEPTTFAPGQLGINKFGMGFATRGADTIEETLFVVGQEDTASGPVGKGVFTLDLDTMKLATVGPFTGTAAGKAAELTGTGDGQLWAFMTTSPASIANVDRNSGATAKINSIAGLTLGTGSAWAFSFWGGDFYVYTAAAGGTSAISRVDPTDFSMTTLVPNVGVRIVGAGVSTCAPLTRPK